MCDNWEDWDNEDYVIPVLNVHNKDEQKRMEERKLVEESENILINDLFTSKNDINISNSNSNSNDSNINNIETKGMKNIKPKISKKKENELKQKEFSEKLRKKKEENKKYAEMFGEYTYDDEYSQYEENY